MRRAPIAALVMALATFAPLGAQAPRTPEAQALRDAGALETRNRLPEAQAILERLLESQPGSVGGLFALERVLRAQGKVSEVLPRVDRFLTLTPDASGVRVMKLKVLAEVDSTDALLRAADDWVKRSPADPMIYREALPLVQRSMDPKRSIDLLKAARKGAGDPVALALEMGDLFLAAGDLDEAAAEWARAGNASADRATEVIKRVGQITDGARRARAASALMDALVRPPTDLKRRALAVQVALAFGRAPLASTMAKALASELEPGPRRAFLESVGTWASAEGGAAVGLWALGAIRSSMAATEDTREIDGRINRAAVAAGDTALAIESGQRLIERLPKASADRRRLMAEEIRMRARRADAVVLSKQWEAFRQEYPQAPELDELAALVSTGLRSSGQGDEAGEVLASVQGPESSLERAYLNLADGRLEVARAQLILAVPGLDPLKGTGELQIASLLGRMSPIGQGVLAKAAVDAHRGRSREGALALEKALPDLPEEDRPLALGQAARFAADVGADEEAARLRTALIERYPESSDAPEAMLFLARWHARSPGGVAQAVELLERLILKTPDAAVAPDARRELQRLRTTG